MIGKRKSMKNKTIENKDCVIKMSICVSFLFAMGDDTENQFEQL